MSNEKNQHLQDVFLNHVRKNRIHLTVFLVNGVKLQGVISWFDNFSILLRRDSLSQLVYKHAISTVMPSVPVQLFDSNAQTEEKSRDEAGQEAELHMENEEEALVEAMPRANGSSRGGARTLRMNANRVVSRVD